MTGQQKPQTTTQKTRRFLGRFAVYTVAGSFVLMSFGVVAVCAAGIVALAYHFLGWIGALVVGISIAGYFTYPMFIKGKLRDKRLRQEAILEAKIEEMLEEKLQALKHTEEIS